MVLDVTHFVKNHPGGEEILAENGGQDIFEEFQNIQHSEKAKQLLKKFQIGTLKISTSKNSPQNTSDNIPPKTNTLITWTAENFPFPIDTEKKMTMGLKTLQEWIICDQNFNFYLREKRNLSEKNPRKMFQIARTYSEEIFQAGTEVLEIFSEFLPKRYPEIYVRNGNLLKIIPVSETVNLSNFGNFHPLELCGRIVQEDLCLLRKNSSEKWELVAGSLCFPSTWTLSEKIGLEMVGVHEPVQLLNEILGNSIYKYFSNLKPNSPVVGRFNWNLEIVPDLRIEPEHPAAHGEITPENIGNLTFRVERQTLKKLPKSGMILFTIGVLVIPFREIVADPERKKILLSHLKSESLIKYKKEHRKYRFTPELIYYLENTNFAKL